MNVTDYINDKKVMLLTCFTGGLFLSVLIVSFGIHADELFLLWLCFCFIALFTIYFDYRHQRKRIQYLLSITDSLDQKYLVAEIAEKPETKLEQIYFQIMKSALKTMTDEVAQSRSLSNEYKDFIEQWIHEIKVPITSIQLMCENNKTDVTRKIMTRAELIAQDVERVLFYARLGSVEKDYLIKEVLLKECVMDVLARNKQYLIQNGVCVYAEAVTDTVYSDDKWIRFILNQIILNSVKYQSDRQPIIQIESQNIGNYVSLSITDNGIGIRESERRRVFDKGFVGSNGRSGKNATGIGLYLCDQLCMKLGINIDIKSELNQYTTILLYFPKSGHLSV